MKSVLLEFVASNFETYSDFSNFRCLFPEIAIEKHYFKIEEPYTHINQLCFFDLPVYEVYYHWNREKAGEGGYKNRESEGIWKKWHPTGQIEFLEFYSDGVIVDKRYWIFDGTEIKLQRYEDSKSPIRDGRDNSSL
jgi:hypothetical protein